jgi:antitoxin component of RelBE/YafQ-DinJ toxin-antitoxin module
MSEDGHRPRRLLLTFRLDQEQRQQLRARLAREGRTMSEVVTHGLRHYVAGLARGDEPPGPPAHGGAVRPPVPPRLVLPERIAAWLRELRSSGHSELLSATLAALSEAGWPLRPLAEALGVSRQAVQARVRRVPAALRRQGTGFEPPPPFPQRRVASANGHRPHLTIKIDDALRSAAHRAAAHDGRSLSQVVEGILDRYVRHGLADADQPARAASRPARSARQPRSSRSGSGSRSDRSSRQARGSRSDRGSRQARARSARTRRGAG